MGRQSLMLAGSGGKNHELRDTWDLNKQSPYKVDQINDKVWRIEYTRENHIMTKPLYRQAMKTTGIDFDDERTYAKIMQGAESYGREMSAQAHKDIAEIKRLQALETISDQDMELMWWKENMIVIKLNSGGVMLFAPVKIHDETEFGKFLAGLGDVKYIVAPSCEHNLQLPGIINKYPNAKIVAHSTTEKKLNNLQVLRKGKLDSDFSDRSDLEQLNNELKDEGVQMFYIAGDCATNSLFVVAHKVALEADLIYTHADGEGALMFDKAEFRAADPKDVFGRIFKFRLLSKPNSPNGFLPPYRFWSMDPKFWPFMFTPPADDGSSCALMASSLRTALNTDFDIATGIHFKRMSPEEFRSAIDKNWNWLDGQSLLSK